MAGMLVGPGEGVQAVGTRYARVEGSVRHLAIHKRLEEYDRRRIFTPPGRGTNQESAA
jgi:hypothetical protein